MICSIFEEVSFFRFQPLTIGGSDSNMFYFHPGGK